MCNNDDIIYNQIIKWLKNYGVNPTLLQKKEITDFVEEHFGKDNIPNT